MTEMTPEVRRLRHVRVVRAIQRSRATISRFSPAVLIRGQVVELVDGDRAWEIIDRISHKERRSRGTSPAGCPPPLRGWPLAALIATPERS